MSRIMGIAEEIIAGKRLGREDDLSFLFDGDIDQLCSAANHIREELLGNRVNLCSIVNGKSGRCSEDCKYCAQSAHNHAQIEEYPFLSVDELMESCCENANAGVHRFSIVTAGRVLQGEEFKRELEAFRRMSRTYDIELCASNGLLTKEQFEALKEAGVSMYHENIETSRRNFPNICTTHTLDEKIRCLKDAKEAGLQVCSGGIIGMGETWEDRVEMALLLREIGVDSIPINVLMPIKGTSYEEMEPLTEEEIKRTFAIFRFLNPEAELRIAAGRILLKDSGRELFESGVNATITGNMLTTSGNNIEEDQKMLKEMGLVV